MMAFLDLLYGAFLGIAHFISDEVAEHRTYKNEIRSLAAGISIAYLLLYLFPELYGGIDTLQRLIFVFVLLGAMSLHIVEKFLYQHKKSKTLLFELRAVHAGAFFVYHFLIGIVVVSINATNVVGGFLFFVPMLFYTGASQLSLSQLHGHTKESLPVKLFLSSSTLIGVILATAYSIPAALFFALLAFVAGALLYNVMVEVVPKEKKGRVGFFLLGAVLYLGLIILLGGF